MIPQLVTESWVPLLISGGQLISVDLKGRVMQVAKVLILFLRSFKEEIAWVTVIKVVIMLVNIH